ncbi:MAG: glutamate racemase [bacterium]|nr:glutamate racemase [bacterium]
MIGVFDSGIGGLTVMRELLREIPECGFVYLGDTARTPYGSKSPETVRRYAREDAQFLLDRGCRLLVIACNTASAIAADDLRAAFPGTPIVEVVTPAVVAAVSATRSGRIGVIGTRATIASGVYEREIVREIPPPLVEGEREGVRGESEARPQRQQAVLRGGRGVGSLTVHVQPCPLLVPLVEEGWLDAPETTSIIRTYLAPLLAERVDTLILGCTHYPLLEPVIAQEMGEGVTIINPAAATARAVRSLLARDSTLAASCRGTLRTFAVTDRTPHFERIASEWLGTPVTLELVAVP